MAFSQIIARLGVQLGLDTASFQTGSRKAQKEMTGLRGNMTKAAKAVSTALAGMVTIEVVQQLRTMTREAVNTVGALGEQAMQLGVTTDALQEFRYVASQTGIEQGEIDKALQRLTRTLGEIREPTKAQAEALAKLGLTAKDLAGLDASQALGVLADRFNQLPDAAERSAVGFDLMGRTFQTLLPLLAEGSAGIQKMIADAREAGIVLTEEEIKRADQAADALTALDMKTQARVNSLLATNAKALVDFETQWAEIKVGAINASIGIGEAFDRIEQGSAGIGKAFYANVTGPFINMMNNITAGARNIVQAVGNMVVQIGQAITGRLSVIWDGALAKIEQVKSAFRNLWDAVVGNSYIPDMVEGIAQEMARLDAVMVAPVTRATTAAQKAFRDMAAEIRTLLDRLFPESAAALQYQAERALLGNIADPGAREAALRALALEQDEARRGGAPGLSWMQDIEPLTAKIAGFEDAIVGLADKAKVSTVKIAKSFKDMATETLNSLGRLTSAIKDGGFLGILEAVIGFGLQLGSTGLFGKGIANRLNNVPGYAGGTNFHPGGLALVGERGPELVSMPRGSRVTPNGKMGGVTNNYFSGNLMTPEFWAMIQNGDIQAAQGGAMLAGAQSARSKKWSLAA